jgi:hypothetical protein
MKQSIKDLKAKGYKRTVLNGLFVNEFGNCFNQNTNRNIQPNFKGNIIINGKQHNLPKLMLLTFKKITIRNGHIHFKNGNQKDFHFENLEYSTTILQKPPKDEDLLNCIRMYFLVEKKLNKYDLLFRFYLNEIAIKRGFLQNYKDNDFELFKDWLNNNYSTLSNSKQTVSKKHNYTVRNGINAINKYLNLLVKECLEDFESGLLNLNDFAPKPLTETQKRKKINLELKKMNINVIVALRKINKKH